MHSQARIVAEADRSGLTRLTHLAGDGALSVRPTPISGRTRVHLIAGAFGPLGGDRLTLEIAVGPDAQLEVAGVAATVVQRSLDGRPSRLDVLVDLAAGASLSLILAPTVITAGASHTIEAQLNLGSGSRLVQREEIIRGRSNEAGGQAHLVTRLDIDGTPILRQSLDLCGEVSMPWHPRAVGSLLVIGGQNLPSSPVEGGAGAAWLELPRGAGRQFTSLGDDPLALSLLLDSQLAAAQLPR